MSIRTGVKPSYSTVTWLLESGRSHLIVPFFRKSVIRLMIRWASAIGKGISSGVSLHAKPNIIPWSPAPMSFPRVLSSSTPWAMSGDCLPSATITAHVDRVKSHIARRVPDLAHDLPHDCRVVYLGLGRDLARQDDQPGCEQRLTSHSRVRILSQDGVEYAVGNLVRHLVRMAHGYGFAREKIAIVIRHGRESPSGSSVCLEHGCSAGRKPPNCGSYTYRRGGIVVMKSNKTKRC